MAFNFMACFQTGFTVLNAVRQPFALRMIRSVSADTKQKGGRLPPLRRKKMRKKNRIPKIVRGIVNQKKSDESNRVYQKDRENFKKGIVTPEMKKRGWS